MSKIIFLGQAGFLIENKDGKWLAIDPYLSDCVERVEPNHIGYKRLQPKMFRPEDLDLNVLVCTHYHRDHYDIDSVPTMMQNKKTKLFCPKDCLQDTVVQNLDKGRVNIIEPGISAEIDGFSIHFINCDHGDGAPSAVGVIVETDGKRILEVGDTCLRLDRVGEYKNFGDIDVLIAPINGMYGNLDAADCVKLSDALCPRLTIPCHFGMFADHRGSPADFIKLMSETKRKFLLMAMGEKYEI